jgi:hypothetical protein
LLQIIVQTVDLGLELCDVRTRLPDAPFIDVDFPFKLADFARNSPIVFSSVSSKTRMRASTVATSAGSVPRPHELLVHYAVAITGEHCSDSDDRPARLVRWI